MCSASGGVKQAGDRGVQAAAAAAVGRPVGGVEVEAAVEGGAEEVQARPARNGRHGHVRPAGGPRRRHRTHPVGVSGGGIGGGRGRDGGARRHAPPCRFVDLWWLCVWVPGVVGHAAKGRVVPPPPLPARVQRVDAAVKAAGPAAEVVGEKDALPRHHVRGQRQRRGGGPRRRGGGGVHGGLQVHGRGALGEAPKHQPQRRLGALPPHSPTAGGKVRRQRPQVIVQRRVRVSQGGGPKGAHVHGAAAVGHLPRWYGRGGRRPVSRGGARGA